MQYWYATGDLEYMSLKGAEVLVETARLWLDVGHYDSQGRFLIHTVTGPDEYTCMINNNYYTNRCAQANLSAAAAVCKALWKDGIAETLEHATGVTSEEVGLFEKAAAAMWFPYDSERDIHAQDDSFLNKPIWDLSTTAPEKLPLLLHYHPLHLYRHQVCKQADTVLAHILFEDGVDESTMRNSYEYYEKITTHDSSLSRCAFSIMAARLGMEDKAYDYFIDTLRTDLDDTHGNTKDGLHTANLGGSWLSMVMGFAGMRLNEDGLHFRCLQPGKWGRTCFRIRYLGRLIKVRMEHGKAEFTLEEGEPVRIYVDNVQLYLD
jgi:alpha,alpha-trehalose phosphorylase